MRGKNTSYSQKNAFNAGSNTFNITDAAFKQFIIDGGELYLDLTSENPSGYITKEARIIITSVKYAADIGSVAPPTISNILQIGTNVDNVIKVNWLSEHQTKYELEIYQDNVKVGPTRVGATNKYYDIPASTLVYGKTTRVSIRVADKYGTWSEWQSINLSLTQTVATISNLLIEGEYWEKAIEISWQSSNQQKFRLEVLKSNVVVRTYTGTNATSYTVLAEELSEGTYTFRVTVAYGDRYVNNAERSITLKNIQTTLDNIQLSGSNIDLELILSWDSTDQQNYEVQILKDDENAISYNGDTAKSVSIPHSTLTTGLHKFRVRVAYKNRWSTWEEYVANLTETLPSVGAFEPDGVITERDNPIRVWWTSQNQSKWKLVIDGTTNYIGTSEKEKILAAGSLQTGKHSMVLTVTYVTSAGVEKHVTKKAEWIVQGNPPIPTITSSNAFNTNRPIITWDTQDQQGYILDIISDGQVVYSTDWQNGLVTDHKVMHYLGNGTYTARVKIINQFSLESAYGSKEFTINTNVSPEILLEAMCIKDYVELTWLGDSLYDKYYIIRNGVVIACTTENRYMDYSAFGECIYIVRGVTAFDTYKDSKASYTECIVNIGSMATVGALEDSITVGLSRNEFNFSGSVDLMGTQIMLNGRKLPVTVFGENENNSFSLKFSSKELFRFIEMCRRREVFLYRDKRQKLYLSISKPNYSVDRYGIEYTIEAIEVDYKEVIAYD